MKLLLTRIDNALLITFSYVISRLTRRVFHRGKPLAVSIEPTNSCNLHCPECPSGLRELTRARGMMSIDTFRNIIDQLSPQLTWLTLYFQGEPYMNSQFTEMVRYARSRQIFVSSSTNGHFMSPETAAQTVKSGLNRLIISLDGTDQASYESYRVGGCFNQVIQGISNLVAAKRELNANHPKIIIQFLVLKTNENQIEEVKRLGKALAVDMVEIKTAQFYEYSDGNPLMPENAKYSRYQKSQSHKVTKSPRHISTSAHQHIGTSAHRHISTSAHLPQFRLKNSLPRHCFRMWSGCVFTWDGKVVPCCYDKDATHLLGDLSKQSFIEIWKSHRYNQFRKQILDHREKIDICQNCTEGMGISKIW